MRESRNLAPGHFGKLEVDSPTLFRRRIGHSKVFFRAGVLGYLEEVRDDIVIKLTRWLQGACWGHLRRKDFAKRKRQRDLIVVVQRNFRKFLTLRHWPWFMLIQKTKPLIGMVNIEEEIREDVNQRHLCSMPVTGLGLNSRTQVV